MTDMKTALRRVADSGAKITGLPKLGGKLPKTKIGGLVDKYHDIRELRLAIGKVTEKLQAEENRILNHIIDNVDADHEGGAVGKRYKGVINREDVPVVEDWPKFYAYVAKSKAFDLLTKALGKAAIKERWESNKKIPGVGSMKVKKLSVTKV